MGVACLLAEQLFGCAKHPPSPCHPRGQQAKASSTRSRNGQSTWRKPVSELSASKTGRLKPWWQAYWRGRRHPVIRWWRWPRSKAWEAAGTPPLAASLGAETSRRPVRNWEGAWDTPKRRGSAGLPHSWLSLFLPEHLDFHIREKRVWQLCRNLNQGVGHRRTQQKTKSNAQNQNCFQAERSTKRTTAKGKVLFRCANQQQRSANFQQFG